MKGKVVVITGASKGIGKSIAMKFAEREATVILNYNKSPVQAETIVKEIEKKRGSAEAVKCDISNFSAVASFISYVIEKYGKIDILINNAGICKDRLMVWMSEDNFDDVIEVNLKGTFNCMRHVAYHMIKQKSGKIINISSIVGITGNIGQTNYAASKAGVIGLTKSAAKELGKYGITVNTVAPGFIKTEMTEVLKESVKKDALNSILLEGFGEPEDIADAVIFLADKSGRYITGQTLCVDGGMSI